MRHAILAACTLALHASTPAFAVDQAIRQAVAAPTRSASNTARDGARHTADEFALFGVTPCSTVMEIWPAGYWTQSRKEGLLF